MKNIYFVLLTLFLFTGCDLYKQCTTPCPTGQKRKLDCSCYVPKRPLATEAQQKEILQAIIKKNEQVLSNLIITIAPDSPLNLTVLPDMKSFKNVYANNIDMFTRLTYQTDNLTLLSLLAPLDNFNDTFNILLQQGADPNLQSFSDLAPLHIAIAANQEKKVTMLLKAGAKVSFEEPNNILINTLNLGKYKSLKALANYAKEKQIAFSFPSDYFVVAMIDNQIDLADAVAPLTSKESLNTPNNFGVLPLVQAAFLGNTGLMNTLISNGADLELRDIHSRTPLLAYLQEVYIAQIEGNFPSKREAKITEIAKYFLEKGVNQNAKDEDGEDVLFYAIRANNTPLVKLLLETYKHDVNTKNNQGETPLFLAAQNAKSLVSMLLAKGANPKVMDKNGRTASIAAAEMGNMDIYDLLENAASTRI